MVERKRESTARIYICRENSSSMSGRGLCPCTLNPSSNFSSLRQNARLPRTTGGHASTCQLQLPKAPVWWAEQAPNSPAAIGKLGHPNGRGAIALNSNGQSGNPKSTAAANPCRRFESSNLRLFISRRTTLAFECFSNQNHDADKRLLPTPKSLGHDEHKSDRRAILKPQLPSELRKSYFDV